MSIRVKNKLDFVLDICHLHPSVYFTPCSQFTISCPLWSHCCCSAAKLCLTLCNSMDRSTPVFPILHHLPGFAQTHVHWVNDAIRPSHPLPPSPFAFSLSQHQGLFQWDGFLHRWPKYWRSSISPSNKYSMLISFRVDWFDLAVQGTLKSLLQHHSLKAWILQCSAFFMVQLSHPYMTTTRSIALTRWTFVGKVMSLLSNMLSRFCHSFPSKEQVSFNFMAAVPIHSDLGAQQNKVCLCFHFLPICHEVMGPDAMILIFLNAEF